MQSKFPKIKTLQKALTILECFTADSPELGIVQIAEMLNLNKSNVHDIISTFQALGYLEQNPITKQYRLGFKLLEYTYIINNTLKYQKGVYDLISNIANELNFSTYFAIPLSTGILYLNGAYPYNKFNPAPYRIIMGERAPYHCTSLGKAMLAFMPQKKVNKIFEMKLDYFTPNTITTSEALYNELQNVKKQGYAIDDAEHEDGIKCMGVPILTRTKKLVGAISISTISLNFDDNKIPHYLQTLRNATREMQDLF